MKVIKTAGFEKIFQSAKLRANNKSKLNNAISALTQGYHDEIPLGGIFDVLKESGVIPVQEDGTEWSGMLVGGAECGSDETRNQVANIDLAVQGDGGLVPIPNASLYLSWCKMQSGRYEVVSYVS
tara:strand:+ start:549 stop:923 length:375 start_codon:yes stop_codon:yes gene_type:complete